MARTKTIVLDGEEYQLQSVTYRWYVNIVDLYLNPNNGRRDTAKFTDLLIKGCVTSPIEVANKGLQYFEERDDIKTPGELAKEIETFLGERVKS